MDLYADGNKIALAQDTIKPNLLANTLQANSTSNWDIPYGSVDWNYSKSLPFYALAKIFRFQNNGAIGTVLLRTNIQLNGTYTFSSMIFEERNAYVVGETYDFALSATIDRKEINLGKISIPTQNKWQKITLTFSASGHMTDIRLNAVTGIPSGGMGVNGWKLERGTTATDWCPAYSDYAMQSDLDDLKEQIEQLKSK